MVPRWYRLRMTRQPVEATCTECGALVAIVLKARIDSYRRSGRTYCSEECRDAWVRRDRSARMSRTNRKYASGRMSKRNPMHRPEIRQKMAETLRRIEHRPNQRGGNGTPTPEPQRCLAEFLGWPVEVVVPTRTGEPPWHYKLDIAHPTMKVCVEVDGGSHLSLSRQASDARKDEFLRSSGWLVFRFSNQDAMEHTAECARTVLCTTSRWSARTPTS